VRELGNGGWDLETLVQNDLLPLEADVFGPFDETGEVSLGSDILAWDQAEFQKIPGETTTHRYQSSWHWPQTKGSSSP
jgi:hypothetical protein